MLLLEKRYGGKATPAFHPPYPPPPRLRVQVFESISKLTMNSFRYFFFLPDVNHEMDVAFAWLGCPPPGTAGHCTKVHCSREGFVFQLYFFILQFKLTEMLGSSSYVFFFLLQQKEKGKGDLWLLGKSKKARICVVFLSTFFSSLLLPTSEEVLIWVRQSHPTECLPSLVFSLFFFEKKKNQIYP